MGARAAQIEGHAPIRRHEHLRMEGSVRDDEF
jgi:hypothetical protein